MDPGRTLLPAAGDLFRPYRLTRPLGEGGMGVVYLAERPDLGSHVAIKILRDGGMSPEARQRFHAEQRVPVDDRRDPSVPKSSGGCERRVPARSETNYYSAAHLSSCGQDEAALRLLRQAIQGGYCSYPVMDTDPFFARVRPHTGFADVRAAGRACHEKFVTERAALDAS